MEYKTLSNGVQMPILGYGVYQVTKDECEHCVSDALRAGYRHIDTAQSYFNEEEVGNAIQKSGIPREELFITTKVWVEHYGYDACRASVLESLRKLKTDMRIWLPSPPWTKSRAASSPTMIPAWWNGSPIWWKSASISMIPARKRRTGNILKQNEEVQHGILYPE